MKAFQNINCPFVSVHVLFMMCIIANSFKIICTVEIEPVFSKTKTYLASSNSYTTLLHSWQLKIKCSKLCAYVKQFSLQVHRIHHWNELHLNTLMIAGWDLHSDHKLPAMVFIQRLVLAVLKLHLIYTVIVVCDVLWACAKNIAFWISEQIWPWIKKQKAMYGK